MKRGYERQNEKVIEKAFKRFQKNAEVIIKSGMYDLLSDAVNVALELHDDTHRSHLSLGDTYGWMLLINGRIDKLEVTAHGDKVGEATMMLKNYATRLPSVGIIGIVMAGMKPANFFSINYEKGILDNTITITRQTFLQYFKAI